MAEPEVSKLPMIDEMVQEVARAAGITPAAAGVAVTSMLRLMAAHLPSPLFGELQAQLQLPLASSLQPQQPSPPPADADDPSAAGGTDPA